MPTPMIRWATGRRSRFQTCCFLARNGTSSDIFGPSGDELRPEIMELLQVIPLVHGLLGLSVTAPQRNQESR